MVLFRSLKWKKYSFNKTNEEVNTWSYYDVITNERRNETTMAETIEVKVEVTRRDADGRSTLTRQFLIITSVRFLIISACFVNMWACVVVVAVVSSIRFLIISACFVNTSACVVVVVTSVSFLITSTWFFTKLACIVVVVVTSICFSTIGQFIVSRSSSQNL